MGWWGLESCANDTCWDHLCSDNIHEITQKEADASLDYVFIGDGKQCPDDCCLGVVIWCLIHGCNVKLSRLADAQELANKLLSSDEYLSEFDEDRKLALEKELKILQTAIDDNGHGTEQHVPGLLEQVSGFFGTGCPSVPYPAVIL